MFESCPVRGQLLHRMIPPFAVHRIRPSRVPQATALSGSRRQFLFSVQCGGEGKVSTWYLVRYLVLHCELARTRNVCRQLSRESLNSMILFIANESMNPTHIIDISYYNLRYSLARAYLLTNLVQRASWLLPPNTHKSRRMPA
jgi:hypothetical protein